VISDGRIFCRVGVSGPGLLEAALFFLFLYSFKETDFLADTGVVDSAGGGDFLDPLDGGGSADLTFCSGRSSRLRLWPFGVVFVSVLDLL
jgi:hypothetical protein